MCHNTSYVCSNLRCSYNNHFLSLFQYEPHFIIHCRTSSKERSFRNRNGHVTITTRDHSNFLRRKHTGRAKTKKTYLFLESQQDRKEQDEDDSGGLRHRVEGDGDQLQSPVGEPHINATGQASGANGLETSHEWQNQLWRPRDKLEHHPHADCQNPFDYEVVHYHRQGEFEILQEKCCISRFVII